MSYKGRLIGLLVMVMSCLGGTFYAINTVGEVELASVIGMGLQLPLGWYIGKQFDKVKYLNKQLHHRAYHDSLTALPNRYWLTNHFPKALERSKLHHRELAIIYIDLDRFKFINDLWGHKAGDEILKQVSERLVNHIRPSDVVVRHGGDEFIILLEDIKKFEVKKVAERILQAFTTPFYIESEEHFMTPSIGISLYPEDGQEIDLLINHADTAMFLSKKKGKNNYQFYIHEDENLYERKVKLELRLKNALEKGEFSLYYQPKVNMDTGHILEVEALIRWNHPELGFISPIEFIPLAEENGMVLPIGNWVLQEACKQNKRWQAAGIKLRTAVNVSSLQFEDPHFIRNIKQALATSNLEPEYLGVEITESVMKNLRQTSSIFQELKGIGVQISVDDFGTGYSSLSVLNKLPVDVVKIDQSFVNEMLINSNTSLLVKTIIEMAENLNFEIIAEGIENKQQAEFLLKNGCKYGQGYYYSLPLPAEQIKALLGTQGQVHCPAGA